MESIWCLSFIKSNGSERHLVNVKWTLGQRLVRFASWLMMLVYIECSLYYAGRSIAIYKLLNQTAHCLRMWIGANDNVFEWCSWNSSINDCLDFFWIFELHHLVVHIQHHIKSYIFIKYKNSCIKNGHKIVIK